MIHDIAFLHTADVHVPTFQKLVENINPSIRVRHDVKEALLSNAVADGITLELAAEVEKAMLAAASTGAKIVVCTCSTIGGIAEKTSLTHSTVSMRIDRAMADLAVESCQHILIIAAVESTLEPTKALLDESSKKLGKFPRLSLELVEGAWQQFENGNMENYYNRIEAHINKNKEGYDAVILAQASMAPVAQRYLTSETRVLASPELGVKFALGRLQDIGN